MNGYCPPPSVAKMFQPFNGIDAVRYGNDDAERSFNPPPSERGLREDRTGTDLFEDKFEPGPSKVPLTKALVRLRETTAKITRQRKNLTHHEHAELTSAAGRLVDAIEMFVDFADAVLGDESVREDVQKIVYR